MSAVPPCEYLRARRLCSQEDIDAVVALFGSVAREEGWRPGDGLNDYLSRSVFFGLWDCGAEGEPVGGLQLVLPDPAGSNLPTHRVWPELREASRPGTAHVSVLAVRSDARGQRERTVKESGQAPGPFGFWLLAAELWRFCVQTGIQELWMEATPRTLRCYERLGWPLTVRGELREHWGEFCYPCSASLRETVGALSEKAIRSATYRRIMERTLDGGDGDR